MKITMSFSTGDKLTPIHEVASYINYSMLAKGSAGLIEARASTDVAWRLFVLRPVRGVREYGLPEFSMGNAIKDAIDCGRELVIYSRLGGDASFGFLYPHARHDIMEGADWSIYDGVFTAKGYGVQLVATSYPRMMFLYSLNIHMLMSRRKTRGTEYDFGCAIYNGRAEVERKTLLKMYRTEY